MYPTLEAANTCLFNPRWKNTANVYSSPETHFRGSRVPSLLWFCLHCLSEFPDQIQLPFRLVYRPSKHRPPESLRVIDEIFGARATELLLDEGPCEFNLSKLDPRLWATFIQIFDHIPLALRTYTLSLNDELLPLIQELNITDKFSLITVLELPGCPGLTDDSISELRNLHTLAALDASSTALSAHGVKSLARALRINNSEEPVRKLRGPWGLRILRMKHCTRVDEEIYPILSSMFPLLSVVDLRGTKCRLPITPKHGGFSVSDDRRLFSSNLTLSLDALQQKEADIQIFSAPKQDQFTLRIKKLCHEDIANALADMEKHHRSQPSRQPERSLSPLSENEDDRYRENYFHGGMNEGGFDSDVTSEHSSIDYSAEDSNEDSSGHAHHGRDTEQEKWDESEEAADSDSQTENWLSSGPSVGATCTHKLYWYDADRYRASTYVPLSLYKNEHDKNLMLYRPTRPWSWLETELSKLLEKETQWEGARARQAEPITIRVNPASRKRLKVQEGLQSMTVLALQRRRAPVDELAREKPPDIVWKNPFRKKRTTTAPTEPISRTGLHARDASRPVLTLNPSEPVPRFRQQEPETIARPMLPKPKKSVPTGRAFTRN